MAQYRYTGPHPVPDEGGELVHPLDVREFDAEPAWGPWELVPPPETDEGAEPPGPPEASPAATGAAPALDITPPPPVTPEGNM